MVISTLMPILMLVVLDRVVGHQDIDLGQPFILSGYGGIGYEDALLGRCPRWEDLIQNVLGCRVIISWGVMV
jgi:hypothetical protein